MRILLKEEKSEQNNVSDLFTFMLFYKLTIVPQIQKRSCPIAGWQPRKSEDLDGLDLIA